MERRVSARVDDRTMAARSTLPAPVAARLAALTSDQRAAATSAPGPVLCVAPAGSGKTTTLVARVCWLVATGTSPGSLRAVTFNRRAAEELRTRLDAALLPLGIGPGAVSVGTLHALGREILRSAGESVEPLIDRAELLAELAGGRLSGAALRQLDDAFSRLKLDAGVVTAELRAEVETSAAHGRRPGPIIEAFLAYERALDERHGLDFDDLVRRALLCLRTHPAVLARWRRRCATLLVDEAQDLDRSQLALALLLAAPANDVFLVGDDDQTIYAWRLADVRRILTLASELSGLRRVDLVTNFRCPAEVVRRAVRLIEHNRERFTKHVRPGPQATGRLRLVSDPGDDVARARALLVAWRPALTASGPAASHAILARTNAELAPYAAVALQLELPYAAADDGLLLEDPTVAEILGRAGPDTAAALPALSDLRRHGAADPAALATLLAWAAGLADPTLGALRAAVEAERARRNLLQRGDAPLVLATAHATKGLEFDVVACVGLDEGRFPSRRSLTEAADPARALEEERRLAYVAWTRARRELWLVYDPGAPSRFLGEAFDAAELAGTGGPA